MNSLRFFAAVSLATCVLAVASCKEEDGGAAPAAGDAGGKIRMVYIPKNTGNPYFDPLIAGFRDAAMELGAEFETVAPATADLPAARAVLRLAEPHLG